MSASGIFGSNWGTCLNGKAGPVSLRLFAELLGTTVLVFFGVGVATLIFGFKFDG
jgi:hypothetical protein